MHVHLKLVPDPLTLACGQCGRMKVANVVATVNGVSTTIGKMCGHCNYSKNELVGELQLPDPPPEKAVAPDRRLRRRADRQARDSAQETGALVHKASGALPYLKSDIRKKGVFRAEQKFTQNRKHFLLKREYLDKIRAETTHREEIPVLEILFVEPVTLKAQETWAVIPWEDFKRLIQ